MDAWDVIPSYDTEVRLSSQTLAAFSVTKVSVERLFFAMMILPPDLRSLLKQNATEAMLLLRKNMI